MAEANPVLGQSRLRINTVKVGVNVLAFTVWHKNRAKRGAWVVPMTMTALGTTACVWNGRQLGR